MIKKIFLLLSLLTSFHILAFEISEFRPNVVDENHTLNPEAIERINVQIEKVRAETDVWAAVYFIPDLKGAVIEDVAEQVFRKWKLGKAGKDNGLLILLSINDRKTRIEVGYGLEGELTDFFAYQVIETIMVPAFKENRFEDGIIQALQEISKKMKGSSEIISVGKIPDENEKWDDVLVRLKYWFILLWGLPALLILGALIVASIKKPAPYLEMRKYKLIKPLLCLGGVSSSLGFFLKSFFTINPGVFVVIFPGMVVNDPMMIWVFNSVGLVIIGVFLKLAFNFARSLFSVSYYSRVKAKRRLDAYRKKLKPGQTYTMFGKSYIAPARSSSGSSFSSSGSSSRSSGSSSSGGGRSGGGGASGGW